MKGLLKKEWFCILHNYKFFGVLFLLYGMIELMQRSAEAQEGVNFTVLCFLMAGIIPLSQVNASTANKWTVYSAALPVSRRDIIMTPYVLAMLQCLVIGVYCFGIECICMLRTGGAFGGEQLLTDMVLGVCVCLLPTAFYMPFWAKFHGLGKSFHLLSGCLLGGFLGAMAVLTGNETATFGLIVLPVALAVFALSCLIAILIFRKQDIQA